LPELLTVNKFHTIQVPESHWCAVTEHRNR